MCSIQQVFWPNKACHASAVHLVTWMHDNLSARSLTRDLTRSTWTQHLSTWLKLERRNFKPDANTATEEDRGGRSAGEERTNWEGKLWSWSHVNESCLLLACTYRAKWTVTRGVTGSGSLSQTGWLSERLQQSQCYLTEELCSAVHFS